MSDDKVVGGKAGHADADTGDETDHHPLGAALAGRLSLTDGGKRDQDESERVERIGEPLMQLGTEHDRGSPGRGDRPWRACMSSLKIALARFQIEALVLALVEAVEVDDVFVEDDDLGGLFGVGAAQDVSAAHDQVGGRRLLNDLTMLGEICLLFLGVTQLSLTTRPMRSPLNSRFLM